MKKRYISRTMLLLVIIMLCYGLVLLFSASITNAFVFKDKTTHFILRQIPFSLFGLICMAFVARLDMRVLAKTKTIHIMLGISTFLLVIVLIPGIGILSGGARRWLPLVVTNFQPSELTKIVLIYYLAWYYSRLRSKRLKKAAEEQAKEEARAEEKLQEQNSIFFRRAQREQMEMEDEERFYRGFSWHEAWQQAKEEILRPMFWVIVSVGLIMMQAHVSASIIIVSVTLCIMASANLHWRSWLIGAGIGISSLIILISLLIVVTALFPNSNLTQRWTHVGRRLTSFVNKEKSSSDDNRQTEQALIATGSGKMFGRGLGQSRQKYLYLSENHNDYIYSVICEELGFVGGTSIILLFAAFLFAGMRIASKTSSMLAQLIASGCTYLIVIQAMLSIGVNLNILPATGISLPLFSYGGTSNIFFLISVGLILSMSKHGVYLEESPNTPEGSADKSQDMQKEIGG